MTQKRERDKPFDFLQLNPENIELFYFVIFGTYSPISTKSGSPKYVNQN